MSRATVFTCDLRKIVARASLRPGIRWGHSGDRDRLVSMGADARWLDSEIGKGSRLVVVEENGKILGYSCYPTYEYATPFSWLVIRSRPGLDVFSVGGFVVPERRGQRIRGDMKRFAARHFVEQGYQRMVSVVDVTNTASLRSNANLGSVPLATLTRIRVGKLNLVCDGRAPRHVGWGTQPFVFHA